MAKRVHGKRSYMGNVTQSVTWLVFYENLIYFKNNSRQFLDYTSNKALDYEKKKLKLNKSSLLLVNPLFVFKK